jgi:hypothetical protein
VEAAMKYYDSNCREFRPDTPEEHNFGFDVVDVCAEDFLVFENHARGYRWIFP